MKYALKIHEDNRIGYACVVLQNGNYDGMPIVDTLPDGNLPDYRYVAGEYIYDPLPVPDPVEPEPTAEERIAALEEENAMLLECVLEMSEIVYA